MTRGLEVTPLFDGWGALLASDGSLDLASLVEDDVLAPLRDHGLVVMRGFGADTDAFRVFTERLSSGFVAYQAADRVPEHAEDQTVQSVNVGSDPIGFHVEAGFAPGEIPRALWFHCIDPGATGDGTLVCDGRRVWMELSDGAKRAFSKKIKYSLLIEQNAIPFGRTIANWKRVLEKTPTVARVELVDESRLAVWVVRDPTLAVDGVLAFANHIVEFWTCPPSRADSGFPTYEDDTPLPRAAVNEAVAVTDRLSRLIAWQAGDVAILDNWRVLHGRPGLRSEHRKVNLRLAKQLITSPRVARG